MYFSRDDQPLSIDHDRVQQLTTISSRARGLRERLYSQVDSSRAFVSISHELVFPNSHRIIQLSSTFDTKASWFPANPRVYIFLIILQLSLIWLMYRCATFIFVHFFLSSKHLLFLSISINRAQELWLDRYYDPFNPELHLYIFKSDATLHVLRSEGARTTVWSLVGHIWDGWIHFIGNVQFCFWQPWHKDAVLQYDATWTPT